MFNDKKTLQGAQKPEFHLAPSLLSISFSTEGALSIQLHAKPMMGIFSKTSLPAES